MITAVQAAEISNTNAEAIERELDQKSEFWKIIKETLDTTMHSGARKVSIPIMYGRDLKDIYAVLRYNGYKLGFTRWNLDIYHPDGGKLYELNFDALMDKNETCFKYFLEVSW